MSEAKEISYRDRLENEFDFDDEPILYFDDAGIMCYECRGGRIEWYDTSIEELKRELDLAQPDRVAVSSNGSDDLVIFDSLVPDFEDRTSVPAFELDILDSLIEVLGIDRDEAFRSGYFRLKSSITSRFFIPVWGEGTVCLYMTKFFMSHQPWLDDLWSNRMIWEK